MNSGPPTLAARVRRLRELAGGINASDASELAGLTRVHVSLIENGTRKDPSGSTIEALARAFGADAGWLLTGQGRPPSKARVRAAVRRAQAAKKAA